MSNYANKDTLKKAREHKKLEDQSRRDESNLEFYFYMMGGTHLLTLIRTRNTSNTYQKAIKSKL
jgi:hypothetical protein